MLIRKSISVTPNPWHWENQHSWIVWRQLGEENSGQHSQQAVCGFQRTAAHPISQLTDSTKNLMHKIYKAASPGDPHGQLINTLAFCTQFPLWRYPITYASWVWAKASTDGMCEDQFSNVKLTASICVLSEGPLDSTQILAVSLTLLDWEKMHNLEHFRAQTVEK